MEPSSGRAAGFTLIELLVALAIMGVLMAIGVPNLYAFIQRQKILGITQQTAIAFRLARLEAIKTSTNAVVMFDTDLGAVVAFNDTNGNKVLDASEKRVAVMQIPKGIGYAPSGLTAAAVTSNPNIALFSSNGSVAAIGGFRFNNAKGDQLEARLLDKATARVQIVKLQGSLWVAQGEGGVSWKWN
jgi:type IV fimbrial biogenesis protein FimT